MVIMKTWIIAEKHAEEKFRIEVLGVIVLCRGSAGRLGAKHVRTAGGLEKRRSEKCTGFESY